MRGDLNIFHCHARGIRTLFPPTFSLEAFSLCSRAWRLSSLEKRSSRTISRFHEVPNLKRRYICNSFMNNRYVMLFLYQSMCIVYWIYDYDYMMLFIRLLFHVSFNIISFHMVILVWGRYNLFCRSLGARGERGGLKGCLDQPSFVKVWTILSSETCLYILAEPFSSTFQPQYVDGLSNPSHRKLSFTTKLATPLGIEPRISGFVDTQKNYF